MSVKNNGVFFTGMRALTLFVAYVSTALFSLNLAAVSGFAAPVWPPTGIALAFTVLFGRRMWPAVFLAAFTTNYVTGAPPLVALAIGIGNTLEAAVASEILSRNGFRPAIDTIRDALNLIFFGTILGPLISATVGVSSLALAGIVVPEVFMAAWISWFVGDALGAMVVAPLLFVILASWRKFSPMSSHRVIETLAFFAAFLALNAAIFLEAFGVVLPIAAILPVLVWAALRFGPRVNALAVFGTAAFAIVGTVMGLGQFTALGLEQSLLLIQIAIASIATAQLVLASANAERRQMFTGLEMNVDERTHELRAQKERTEAILENIADGVLMVDAFGHVTVFNAEAEKILRFEKEEVVGEQYEDMWKLVDLAGKSVRPCPMQVTISTGRRVEISYNDEPRFVVRQDGNRVRVTLSSAPVFLDRELIGAVVTFREI